MEAVIGGHVESIKVLAAAGANINAQQEDGVTALMLAMLYHYNSDTAEALIAAKADVNLADKNGWTALMYAISKNCVDNVEILLKAGADPNRISKGKSPLKLAKRLGNKEIIQALTRA